ncbi:hypothetical protein D1BOALGB6SA_7726 [Olavius sp. associated proteobacterium Delta 1]|nr:hypothetical protein D1BOALGB6SA_7726 [Olavius sp. associated proteobacterium Delta 1]
MKKKCRDYRDYGISILNRPLMLPIKNVTDFFGASWQSIVEKM